MRDEQAERIGEYRKRAETMAREARLYHDRVTRGHMLRTAQAWQELARQAEETRKN